MNNIEIKIHHKMWEFIRSDIFVCITQNFQPNSINPAKLGVLRRIEKETR